MPDTLVVWTVLTSTMTYKEEQDRLTGVGGGGFILLTGIVTHHPEHCSLVFTESDTYERRYILLRPPHGSRPTMLFTSIVCALCGLDRT